MSSVIDISHLFSQRSSEILVLVDLYQINAPSFLDCATPSAAKAITNCRIALMHARAIGYPIAFVRDVNSQLASCSRGWVGDFVPRRTDMVFERDRSSCYASSAFDDMMRHSNKSYVLAGLGEGSCLATAVDAFHRNHTFVYLADASINPTLDDFRAVKMQRVIARAISLFGPATSTNAWVRRTSQRAEGHA